MTPSPSNSNPPIDESTLLAWIEGELGPQERRRVSAALALHPDLRDRVERMRADRDLLRTMPDAVAPPGLLAGLADAIEREMLLVDADHEDESGSPLPIHAAPGTRAATHTARAARARRLPILARPVSLAASILLATGAVFWLSMQIRSASGPIGTRPADGSAPSGSDAYTLGRMASARSNASESPADDIQTAQTPLGTATGGSSSSSMPNTMASAPDRPAPDHTASAPVPSTQAEHASPVPHQGARLTTLASQGRLIIRVRTSLADATARHVERIGLGSDTVRVLDEVPQAIASSIAPTPSDVYPRRETIVPILTGSGDLVGSHPAPEADDPDAETVIARMYLMELDLTASTLNEALEVLSARPGTQAVFEVLDAPLPDADGSDAEFISADRLLWWSGPQDGWVARARIPVVIETLE